MTSDLPYWLALVRFRKFGAIRLARLADAFPSMQQAFLATASELMQAGIPAPVAELFVQARPTIDPAAELHRLHEAHIHAITLRDPSYPPRLKTIHDPPGVLFVRGTLPDPTRPHIAVVGSRHATAYGTWATRTLIPPLVASGAVIVSGLAYGIDATAHTATLDANGTTLAVLASGLDRDNIYPSQNRALAERILASNGALLSEFPLGIQALKQHFPFRNRVIAGLCQGTLVVEAAARSGSLITAQSALESGRDVYAVPGPIDSPLSEGPNNLLKMGATPVTKPSDMLSDATTAPAKSPTFASEEEQRIWDILTGHQGSHVDEISVRLSLPADQLNRVLTLLEMRGVIKHTGGGYYTRAS